MNELVFEVSQEADGGYVAEALGESIFTQADSWEELRKNVREAVAAFYFDRQGPKQIRLHFVGDEILAACRVEWWVSSQSGGKISAGPIDD